MLSPEYLDGIAESIKAIFSELETKILSDIARRISGADFQMTPSAEFQIYKLQQIGASSKYVRQQIAKYLNISEKELNKIFKEAAIKSIQPDVLLQKAMIDAGMLPKDTIPLTASPAITQTLIADLQRTKNTMKKMTGTIAIDSTGLINKYLDQAQLMVQSGAFTKEKAIETAVNNLARENIQVMDYT
ncbi:MAG: phage minor capsid protein, partial [Bacteroidaceae bacterium]